MTKPKQDLPNAKAQGKEAGRAVTEAQNDFRPQRGTARPRVDSDTASFRRSITLQLDADSSPKWETVTEKNRAIWREILSHSKTVEALGLAPTAAPGPPATSLPAAAAGALYNALARIEALVCSKALKVPVGEALPVLAFTEEEKAQLVPVTQALADKWIPVIAQQYGVECAFGFLLFSMTAQKLQALRAVVGKSERPPAVEAKDIFEPKEAIQ